MAAGIDETRHAPAGYDADILIRAGAIRWCRPRRDRTSGESDSAVWSADPTLEAPAVLHTVNLILAAAGLLLVSTSIVLEMTVIDVFAMTFAGFIVAATAAPYALLAALSRRLPGMIPQAICAAGLAGLSAFWIWAFGGVFWWNPAPDAQDGLALLVFPALMIAGAGAVAVTAWIVARVT